MNYTARQASLSLTISLSLLKLMSVESVMLSKCLNSASLFSSCPQSFPLSGSFPVSRLFASGGQSIGVAASACPSNEYSRLISFRINIFDLHAIQGTLKSLIHHHNLITHWFLEPQENKICHCFHFSPSVCHEVMGPNVMILVFWMLSF